MFGRRATGCALGAYEAALKYAQERIQFGKPIGSFQLVRDLLAKMIANITASQCLIMRQAQLHAEGKLTDAHAALAKAFAAATATRPRPRAATDAAAAVARNDCRGWSARAAPLQVILSGEMISAQERCQSSAGRHYAGRLLSCFRKSPECRRR